VAYIFGDSFDLYAAPGDAVLGYWDAVAVGGATLVAGRFAGGQALQMISAAGQNLMKSSGANDAIHHIVVAYRQTAALSGSGLGLYFQLIDNVTNQVCIVFRQDGVILLTSATPGGTVLATYSGAVTAQNTWFAFEFEVIISNTVGRFRARKNGNASDDFDSGATLNTRPGANSYANKLFIAQSAGVNATQIDDLLWRSDAASVAWVGDIRTYIRLPATDASVQFSPLSTAYPLAPFAGASSMNVSANQGRYSLFTSPITGTIGSVIMPMSVAATGNFKCSIYSVTGGLPATALGSATPINAPGIGNATLTFGTPVSISAGTQYFVAFCSDTSSGQWTANTGTGGSFRNGDTYASFPSSSPVVTSGQPSISATIRITPATTANFIWVNEAIHDDATSYVYDNVVGHADFYNLAALAVTPVSVVAVTTRGFLQKSDAGTRNGAVQLKSGATTVNSGSVALSTTWGWMWRTDLNDPATGSAWTPVGVSNAQIGPICTV
jgi:hypothetical protein